MRTIVVLNKANGKPTIIHFDNVESIDYISDTESQFVYVSGRTVNVEMSLREIANTIRSTFNANINHLLLNYRSNAIGQFNNLDGTQVDIDSTGKVNPSSTTTPTSGTNNGGNTGSVGNNQQTSNGNNSGTTGNSVSNTGSTGTSNTGTTNVDGNTNNQGSNSDTTSGATNGSGSTTDNKDTSGSSGTDGKDTGSDKQDSTDNKDKTDDTSNTGDSTGTVNSPGGTGNQRGSDSSTSNPANGDESSGTQTGGSDTSSTTGDSGSTTGGQTDALGPHTGGDIVIPPMLPIEPPDELKPATYTVTVAGNTVGTNLSYNDAIDLLGSQIGHDAVVKTLNGVDFKNTTTDNIVIGIKPDNPDLPPIITKGDGSNPYVIGNRGNDTFIVVPGTKYTGEDLSNTPYPGTADYPGSGVTFITNTTDTNSYNITINGDTYNDIPRSDVPYVIGTHVGDNNPHTDKQDNVIVNNKHNNTFSVTITTGNGNTRPIDIDSRSNNSIVINNGEQLGRDPVSGSVTFILSPADGSELVLPKLPDYEGKLVLTYMSTYEDMNTVLVDSIHSEEFKEFVKQRQINITVKENTNTFVMNSVGTYYLFGINKEGKSNWTSGTYLVDMDLNEPVDGYFFRGTGYPGPRDTVPDFTGLPVDGSDSPIIVVPDVNYSITVSNYTDGDDARLFDKLTDTELADFLQPYGITITNATPHTITLNSTRPEFDSIRIERLTHNGSAELELDIGNKFDFSQAEGSRVVTAYAPNLGNFKVSVKRRESGLVEEVIETRRLSDHYVSSALYSLGITVSTSIRNGINSDIVNITEFSNDARENISELIIEHPVYQSGERRFEGLDAFTTNTDYAVDSLFFGRKTIVIPIPEAIPVNRVTASVYNVVGSQLASSELTYSEGQSADFSNTNLYAELGHANLVVSRYSRGTIAFSDLNDDSAPTSPTNHAIDYLEITDHGNTDGIVGDFGNRATLELNNPYNMNELMKGYKSRQFVFTGIHGFPSD